MVGPVKLMYNIRHGIRTEITLIFLHVTQVKVFQRLLRRVCCSHLVASPHHTVQAFEVFRAESPQWPCSSTLLLQVPEGMHVDERFLPGFRTETPLILLVKAAM